MTDSNLIAFNRIQLDPVGRPYSESYRDIYFSSTQGIDEVTHVFINPNQILNRGQKQDVFTIAETGFGTGLNFMVSAFQWQKMINSEHQLRFISIEKHPIDPHSLSCLYKQWEFLQPLSETFIAAYSKIDPAVTNRFREQLSSNISIEIIFEDITTGIDYFPDNIDAWFLDGFNPRKNPVMWSEKVLETVTQKTVVGGTFSTFTAAGNIRRKLATCGFEVFKTKGFGQKREMLYGIRQEER